MEESNSGARSKIREIQVSQEMLKDELAGGVATLEEDPESMSSTKADERMRLKALRRARSTARGAVTRTKNQIESLIKKSKVCEVAELEEVLNEKVELFKEAHLEFMQLLSVEEAKAGEEYYVNTIAEIDELWKRIEEMKTDEAEGNSTTHHITVPQDSASNVFQ